jgi:hypothetical protein
LQNFVSRFNQSGADVRGRRRFPYTSLAINGDLFYLFRHVYCINNFGAKVLPPNITGNTMFVVFFGMMNWELKMPDAADMGCTF